MARDRILSGPPAGDDAAAPPRPSGIGRIPILEVSPTVGSGDRPAKAVAGEVIPFGTIAFREGHGLIGVDLVLTAPDDAAARHRMQPGPPGTDRWRVEVRMDHPGLWRFHVEAWADEFATWWRDARIKVSAGVDAELMLAIGSELLTRAAGQQPDRTSAGRLIRQARDLADGSEPAADRLDRLSAHGVIDLLAEAPLRSLTTASGERTVRVERTRASVGSWYEFFPRSIGAHKDAAGSWISGTFRTAAERLPQIAAMGFDVIYLPPIHPIGVTNRKGADNALTASAGEPGSPWAIGSAAGGHDAVHPDLGTLDDFRRFVTLAADAGLEVALDLALQASPDHPWVREHPEWFTRLPDGSIAAAENPPKKYEDIYPLDFDNDPEGLRSEILRIVRGWIGLGVRIFRVDNPHTKPAEFWEWLITTVNRDEPDVIFLAEAFTRPAPLTALATVGFQQSYTYFTWRNTKAQLEEFLHSIAHISADVLRPNLFVNTPDILTEYLQFGGPAAFWIRAAIAACAGPSWGVYSGYELFESVARPGTEEYIDNEKYEYRPRDWAAAEAAGKSLAPRLELLNRIRRDHPALRQLRCLTLHRSDDDAVLVFSKRLEARFADDGKDDTVIVVANVDPHSVRETIVHLELEALGLAPDARVTVRDLVTGHEWVWGADNYVRLDAFAEPVHILHIEGAAP